MICIYLDNKFEFGIWFGISNTCSVWSNWVGQNRKTDDDHYQDCIEEGFQLTRVQFDRDGERDREALGMGYCSINSWDGSDLELAEFRKTFHTLKPILQCFSYLVIRIHRLLRCEIFYFGYISY